MTAGRDGSEREYYLIAGASGTGLRAACEKLSRAIPNLAVEDVERRLCALEDTRRLLGYKMDASRAANSGMFEVTWNLPRPQVVELSRAATSAALDHLANSDASPSLLAFRPVYYAGRRDQFYSTFDPNLLVREGLRPSRLVLLIDDVYDVYCRLNRTGALFTSTTTVNRYLSRIKGDERVDIALLPSDRRAALWLQWQISVMARLLTWRQLTVTSAQTLARQLDIPFMVFSTKQNTSAVAKWLEVQLPSSVYLSHPISGPRREQARSGVWPTLVGCFNELQQRFVEHEVVTIMPTGIDEFRIRKTRAEGELSVRLPELSERWPLPAAEEHLLYSRPPQASDVHHAKLLSHAVWQSETIEGATIPVPEQEVTEWLRERANGLLQALEQQIESQVSARDHLFVDTCPHILVFRPFYEDGTLSRGVRAEIEYWRDLSSTRAREAQFNSTEPDRRCMIFIHYEEDVEKLIKHDSRAVRGELKSEMIHLCRSLFGISSEEADQAIQDILGQQADEMLDHGMDKTIVDRVRTRWSEIRDGAESNWLLRKLKNPVNINDSENTPKTGVWICRSDAELRQVVPDIAGFIRGDVETIEDNRWLPRLAGSFERCEVRV